MFIDLLDVLRCPEPHDETWLVGTFDAVVDRDVVRGTLGCPICHAQYPVRDRIVHLGAPRAPVSTARSPDADDLDAPTRLGGMLELVGGGGMVVLGGDWALAGRALAGLVDDLHVVLLDAPEGARLGHRVSALVVGDRMPLAAGCARGIALDGATATPPILAGAVRALRARGRLVAPVEASVPDGIAELARDEQVWVGERSGLADSKPVGLARARRAGDASGGAG